VSEDDAQRSGCVPRARLLVLRHFCIRLHFRGHLRGDSLGRRERTGTRASTVRAMTYEIRCHPFFPAPPLIGTLWPSLPLGLRSPFIVRFVRATRLVLLCFEPPARSFAKSTRAKPRTMARSCAALHVDAGSRPLGVRDDTEPYGQYGLQNASVRYPDEYICAGQRVCEVAKDICFVYSLTFTQHSGASIRTQRGLQRCFRSNRAGDGSDNVALFPSASGSLALG
jgi:hypothetical protein